MPVRSFHVDLTDGTYWAIQWAKRMPHLAIRLEASQVVGDVNALDWTKAERCTGWNSGHFRPVSPAFVRMIEHRKVHAPKAGMLPPPLLHKPPAPHADPNPQ
jgi:hypothetical protein